MHTFKKFSHKSFKIGLILIFCLVYVGFDAQAQEEKNKDIPELDKVEDNFGSFENPGSSLLEYANEGNVKSQKEALNSKVITPIKKENQLYRQGSDKDIVKKENVSTLSFNLFLYIMDKFKEDNK